VNCYARDHEFRDHLATFNQISRTFAFEPGQEWTDPATRPGLSWGRIGVKALIGAIVGALGAAGVVMRRRGVGWTTVRDLIRWPGRDDSSAARGERD
jgi:hypothetical protein